MGSVVIDAVNSFFGHTSEHPAHAFRERSRSHTSTPPQSKRARTPSRTDTPMSASSLRASSAASSTTTQEEHAVQQQGARTGSQSVSIPTGTRQQPPPTPPLAARSPPPPERTSNTTQGHGPPTPGQGEVRPARSGERAPKRIKVRDLEQIQHMATEDMSAFSETHGAGRPGGAYDDSPQYEISDMKVEHIIEMVAGLLTKITTTNDVQHEHLHRQTPSIESTNHLNAQTNSVLAFHGKNVPSITILSYLSRINKYCPTSYEVFLSLLVYFDRMTERVNAGPMQSLRQANEQAVAQNKSPSSSISSFSEHMEGVSSTEPPATQTATPPASGSFEKASQHGVPGTPHSRSYQMDFPPTMQEPSMDSDPYNLSHFFVVDSFNIHRLVIAGVTCASKFFSDIFYTNSRYAKVGGLPLAELNHLELQYLLLNDFRLSVPVEEIEAYGTMLVEFYAREVVAQQRAVEAMQMRSESSSDSTSTVRTVN